MKILSYIHVYAGFASLLLFWAPLILKKGSTWHRQTGIAFSIGMVCVIISAAIFSVNHLMKKEYPIGLGFSFLSLLSIRTLTEGFMAARLKTNISRINYFLAFVALCISLLSAFMIYDGYILKSDFLIILGIIGALLTVRWRTMAKNKKQDWLRLHYRGMIFSGVAAYTAFLIIGYNSFFGGTTFETGGFSIIRWILPTVFGISGLVYLNKIYIKGKFRSLNTANPNS